MNQIVKPIVPDGRTGYDKYGQLISWTKPDAEGNSSGRMIKDVTAHKCYICDKSWELTSESLRDQVVFDGKVAHDTCYYGWQKLTEYYTLQNALIDAGYLFSMTEAEPQYPHSTPWQTITILHNDKDRTDTGRSIFMGRRKRVWSINFKASNEQTPSEIAALFEDVEDTKYVNDDHFIVHAWSKKQLVDYLRRFRETINNTDRDSSAESSKVVATATLKTKL